MAFISKIKGLSKGKKILLCSVITAVIAAIVIVCILIARNDYLATTMRLLRVEGTVNIEDTNGTSKPVIDNIRFQSGDALNTGKDGLASVSLDDTKIVTLQNDSRAEFYKKQKKLELKLTKGALFFEVTEHLNADETYEITTSNMTVGIRGTSGYIYYDDNGRESIIVTDGVVKITAKNPDTGEVKTVEIRGGQGATVFLFNDRVVDTVDFKIDDVKEEDLPDFVLKMLLGNDQLIDKICDFTGWDKQKLIDLINGFLHPKDEEPTVTPTEAPAPEATFTPTPGETDPTDISPTPEPSETPTPPGKATPTPGRNTDPTATPTPDPSADVTPTEEPTPTPSYTDPSGSQWTEPTITPTEAPTPTSEPTATPTATPSPSPSPSPSPTPAPKVPSRDSVPRGYEEEIMWDEDKLIFVFGGVTDPGEEPVEEPVGDDIGMDFVGYVDGKWIQLDFERDPDTGAFTYFYMRNEDKIIYYKDE